MKKTASSILLFLLIQQCCAQFVPGTSYYSADNYIEYLAGDLPLIMSVPHGGYLQPAALKDRSCTGCIYGRDLNSQEMARDIANAIYRKSGCRLHVIINLLYRRKLDANRDLQEAADGDSLAERAWYYYQSFIDTARQEVMRKFGKGLFFDLHGHAHLAQRAELGYNLTGTHLRMSDADLNGSSLVNRSTIRNLAQNNPLALSHAELIRGTFSLGKILMSKGWAAVPSKQDPFPMSSQSFFSGGYTVQQEGSAKRGSIDAVQIECAQVQRSPATERMRFADSLASALLQFVKLHYFPNQGSSLCVMSSIEKQEDYKLLVHKNGPGNYSIEVDGRHQERLQNGTLELLDVMGRALWRKNLSAGKSFIDMNNYDTGLYFLRVSNGRSSAYAKLMHYTW